MSTTRLSPARNGSKDAPPVPKYAMAAGTFLAVGMRVLSSCQRAALNKNRDAMTLSLTMPFTPSGGRRTVPVTTDGQGLVHHRVIDPRTPSTSRWERSKHPVPPLDLATHFRETNPLDQP